MIIRLMGLGQYRIEDRHMEELNRIDNTLVDIVQKDDHERFQQTYQQLINYVQTHGTPVPEGEIVESHIIIPPEDLTLEEARKIFKGQGIIED
jgi:hypothetical protein